MTTTRCPRCHENNPPWRDDDICVDCLVGQWHDAPTSCRHCGRAWIDRMPLGPADPMPPDATDCPCTCHRGRTLHEYLGLTWEQYARWAKDDRDRPEG